MGLSAHCKMSRQSRCREGPREKARDGRFMLIDGGKVPSGIFLMGFPENINRFRTLIILAGQERPNFRVQGLRTGPSHLRVL